MPIIGTAGHVDHGKSTLVEALTGIDPDRLEDEKRRGMTIDLGFAHLDLPSVGEVGIVDVPGHARFLPNMLAGVHGLDGVLLVVAADEGVMPQTREHLDIMELVGVERMIVALTKVDLVDEEAATAVEAEVSTELARRGLAGAIIRVAAPDRRGMEGLASALTELCRAIPPPAAGNRPRLPIDRAFVMAGFGPVVTGSLLDGDLEVTQDVEVVPSGVRARIRGLQQYGHPVERALAGGRLAVNLQRVDRDQLSRGQVLAPPGTLGSTSRVDVRLRVLASADEPLVHDARVRVFCGTAETSGRVVMLDGHGLDPGSQGWVQLRMSAELAMRKGDVVVLRRPSPARTIAGGTAVDLMPPTIGRRGRDASPEALARLEAAGSLSDELRRAPSGLTTTELEARLGLKTGAAAEALRAAAASGRAVLVEKHWFDADRWEALQASAVETVAAYHRDNPARSGMPRQAVATLLRLPGRTGRAGVDVMLARGALDARGVGAIAVPGHVPELTEAQQAALGRVLQRLSEQPLSPPRASELAAIGLDAEVRRYIEEQELAVPVAPDMLMLPGAVDQAKGKLRALLETRGSVTVAEARDVLGSSRRTMVPLLEYFDAAGLTLRDGDLRRLRRP
jgi:selenocysteine-specific elongation factor